MRERLWRPYREEPAAEAGPSASDLAALGRSLTALRLQLAVIKAELRGKALHPSHYDPNQPRVPAGNSILSGRWTSGGGGLGPVFADASSQTGSSLSNPVMSDASPDPTTVWAQYAQYGSNSGDPDPAIERTREILHNTLVRVNSSVSSRQDILAGRQYGVRVHKEFADAVREQDLPGIGIKGVEQSFDAKGLARYGLDGSIRTDVVLRNDEGKIIAIYDVKTGNATMGPTRAEEIRAYTRVGTDVPIIILHAVRGSWRR
jgi:hypothetical protein